MESVQKAKPRRKRKEGEQRAGRSCDSFEKAVDNHMKSALTFDNKQIFFATEETDYGQPMACITYPYNDSGFGGVWAAYEPHAVLHPQIAGGTSTRVPLPREPSEDEPIYVNPKQYHGILRRRQLRAKLEAQNKLVKVRKPYLHESRHLHAMKRARGSGGRFLNTKQLQQQSRTASTANGANASSSTNLLLGGATSRERTLPAFQTITSEENNRKAGAYAPAMANDDAFQHQAHCLSFLGWFGQASMEGAASGMRSGTQQRVPVMR